MNAAYPPCLQLAAFLCGNREEIIANGRTIFNVWHSFECQRQKADQELTTFIVSLHFTLNQRGINFRKI